MGNTVSPELSAHERPTPALRPAPMRRRLLTALFLGLCGAGAALSSLVLGALRAVGLDLDRDAEPAPRWYPDESVSPAALELALMVTSLRGRAGVGARPDRVGDAVRRAG